MGKRLYHVFGMLSCLSSACYSLRKPYQEQGTIQGFEYGVSFGLMINLGLWEQKENRWSRIVLTWRQNIKMSSRFSCNYHKKKKKSDRMFEILIIFATLNWKVNRRLVKWHYIICIIWILLGCAWWLWQWRPQWWPLGVKVIYMCFYAIHAYGCKQQSISFFI